MNIRTRLSKINKATAFILKRCESAQKEQNDAEAEAKLVSKHADALERELDKLHNAYGDDSDGLWVDMTRDLEDDLDDLEAARDGLNDDVDDLEDKISCIEMDVEQAFCGIKNATGARL